MEIRRFDPDRDKTAWDAFVLASRNGVFLFQRGYMDYHAHRFRDRSLMFFDRGRLCGVLPCHEQGDAWVSHAGLSFGGLVWAPSCGLMQVVAMFEALGAHMQQQGVRRLRYTPVPTIYARGFAEDDRFALHRLGAKLVGMEPSTTVDLQTPPRLASGKRQAANKARSLGVSLQDSTDFKAFWCVLAKVLHERHHTSPTHTIQEIEQLAHRFDEIKLRCAYQGTVLLAGVVHFRYGHVLHTQYMAATPAGRATGALDALLVDFFAQPGPGITRLNFGKSTTHNGTQINTGLLGQKEMMGGRTTLIETWCWEPASV